MKSRQAIVWGLGSSAGVFVGMFGYSTVVKNDPGRGIITGFIAACLVLVTWAIIALFHRDTSSSVDAPKS